MSLRILAVSVAPLFRDAVHGGSQRVLVDVARALADAGHRVRIACGERAENRGGFDLADGIAVEPVLRLRGYFPDPYEVPPHQIAHTARDLRPLVDWADRIYLHADIFHFRSLVPAGVPLIRSFHDFHYETALVSAFAYPADLTIVPSDYLRRCIEASVGRSGLRVLEPLLSIPNGIDLDIYRPDGPSGSDRPNGPGSPEVPDGIEPKRAGDLVLLHPHRPDPRKGIEQALALVGELRRRHAAERVRLLVPRHIDAASDPGVASYYAEAERRAIELGIRESVEFHPWYGERAMPALYRFADVTLCLGNFIESFGLTAYESLACGTPVVAARVGALRDAPDLPDLRRVEYGDIDACADAVLEAASGMKDAGGATELLASRYSRVAMAAAYVAAIADAGSRGTGAGPRGMDAGPRGGEAGRKPVRQASARHGLNASPRSGRARVGHGSEQRYELAPWCHVTGNRIYNDYAYRHFACPALARWVSRGEVAGEAVFTLADLAAGGVPSAEVQEALDAGSLIPVSVATV